MRIMKWKEAVDAYGTFLYTSKEYKDSQEWSEKVQVSYPTSNGRLCIEPFPSSVPNQDYDIGDYDDYQDNLEQYEIGNSSALVSYMDTRGDVLEEGDEEQIIIVYDNEDIDVWISKLKSLKR